MQEIIVVCKPVTLFHTAGQAVLAPEVGQSVTGTDLNIKSLLAGEIVFYKEADFHQLFFVNVKVTIQLAMKAQSGGSAIALRIYKLGARGVGG